MFINILSKESKKQGALVFEVKEAPSHLVSKLIRLNDAYSIPPKDVYTALKESAAKGTLTFDHQKVIADFYSKMKLHYRPILQKDGSLLIESFVTMNKEIPLKQLDLVLPGSPGLFFKDNFLKFFDPDLDSSWIKRALKTITIEPNLYAQWIKEAEEIPECSPLFSPITEEIQPREKRPSIRLRDQRGTFIDFLIDEINVFDMAKSPEIQQYEQDLLDAGYGRNLSDQCYYCPTSDSLDAIELLIGVGWKVFDKSGKLITVIKPLALSFTLTGEKINVEEKHGFPTSESPLKTALQGKHLVPFDDGSFGLLPKDFLAKCSQFAFDIEEEEGKLFIPKFKAGALVTNEAINEWLHPSMLLIKEKLLQQNQMPSITKQGFQGTLRPYQEIGSSWLHSLYTLGFHGLLADEMGLGKTVQVIALLSSIGKNNCPHLIVMPKSLLFNWKREFERFLPSFKVYIHTGPDREKKPEKLLENDVILTSYPMLRQDCDLLKTIKYHVLVLDEAHLIKNASTQVSLAARKLSSSFRISLTGTPLENSVEDLISQFAFLMPNLIKETQSIDQNALKILRKKIRPFILRRKKTEVAKDLPELIQQTVLIDMEEEERIHYHNLLTTLREQTLNQIKTEGLGKSRFQIFEAILRLRQYACHPKLTKSPYSESSKLTLLSEEIAEALSSGTKVLVFSQFTSMLDLMGNAFTQQGIAFLRLDGSTKNREEVVCKFQESDKPMVFLISLKAGGVGLNLETADTVFLYEPWWNDAVEDQAIARAHRIGRKSPVIAKRYIVSGTIEQKIMQLKERKRMLSSALIEDSDTPSSFTEEDIEFLFSE